MLEGDRVVCSWCGHFVMLVKDLEPEDTDEEKFCSEDCLVQFYGLRGES